MDAGNEGSAGPSVRDNPQAARNRIEESLRGFYRLIVLEDEAAIENWQESESHVWLEYIELVGLRQAILFQVCGIEAAIKRKDYEAGQVRLGSRA